MCILFRTSHLRQALCVLTVFLTVCSSQDAECNRRPLGTNTAPLPADNRFVIDIAGVDDKYIPDRNYKIRLYSRNNQSSFIAFTISANGDHKFNEKNPRKPIELLTGRISSYPDPSRNDTITSDVCINTVLENNITPKTYVEALWIAPPKENQCVTIYAYVAVKPDVWYSSDGPLSKRVCEDVRNAEDMPPTENDNCQVCEEARYELQFQGMWSYNTHPKMYPTSNDVDVKFSDVVGASHSKNFAVFHPNTDASTGLRMLAEHGNTTQLEWEILEQLGTNVRTLIKATGQSRTNMTTISSFRVSREQHLVSLVSAIIPSPDWFLGVANLELCDESSKWTRNLRLNLYPMDAGTDSGSDFTSANEETSPPQPISPAIIAKDVEREKIKPFAKLKVNLVRTYTTPYCVTESPPTITGGDGSGENTEPPQQPPPMRTTEAPLPTDPTLHDCSMTQWEDWLPCEGECIDGKLVGYQTRLRYYVVDGVEVGKNFENNSEEQVEVPEECLKYETSDIQKCDEECEEPTEPEAEVESAQRRIWKDPVKPGYNWGRRK